MGILEQHIERLTSENADLRAQVERLQAAGQVAAPPIENEHIIKAWRSWPHQAITSAKRAIDFTRHVEATASGLTVGGSKASGGDK